MSSRIGERQRRRRQAFTPGTPPLSSWGKTPDLQIEAWRENHGAVSYVSQRYPFTHHREPFGREGRGIDKGAWYFERVEKIVGQRFDHLDPGFGATLKRWTRWRSAQPHRRLYRKLNELLL